MRTALRSSRYRLALACLAATTLVACGGGTNDEDQASGSQDVGPLGELLGWNYDPAESRKQELAREEAVALCMKDAGYEYIPVDYAAQFPSNPEQDEQFTNPEEFGKKYGYGIVYNYNLYERPGAGGEGTVDPAIDEGFEDPNWEYQQTLSPGEQEAYQKALNGDPAIWESMGDNPEEFVSPPLEDQGCYGKAQLEVYGESPYENPELSGRLDEIFQQMEDDPRIEDASIEWSDCVYEADANWDFLNPGEVYQYFEQAKSRLQGLRRVELDPETGEPFEPLPDDEYVTMSMMDADGNSYGYVGEPEVISDADLDELQKEEIDLWKVDQDCQDKAGIEKVQREVEKEIADGLLAEFPELADQDN